jgi:serine/threonine-protein kinase HipA
MPLKRLSVYFQGWGENGLWGRLADDGARILFEYSAEALQKGMELSPLNLPLQKTPFDPFPSYQWGLPGILSDGLPDGWGLVLMDRIFRKRGKDPASVSPLERLAFVGSRAMGALAFEPALEDESKSKMLEWLELAKDIEHTIAGKGPDVLREMAHLGGSPQGARPKVLVYFDLVTNRLSNRSFLEGEPWLVKFPAENESKEVCAVEKLYADLLSACGIETSATRYFDLDSKRSAFGTKRFDREGEIRIPTHTLAGLLHADHRVPSTDALSFLRATRFLTRDEREVKRAFERIVFNVLFNNRDDHAKNFSYRMEKNGTWTLAPAYDVTFSSGPRGEHHMDVEGEGAVPGREHLLSLAQKAGLRHKEAENIIERFCTVSNRIKSLAASFPLKKTTLSLITKTIEKNRHRLLG